MYQVSSLPNGNGCNAAVAFGISPTKSLPDFDWSCAQLYKREERKGFGAVGIWRPGRRILMLDDVLASTTHWILRVSQIS